MSKFEFNIGDSVRVIDDVECNNLKSLVGIDGRVTDRLYDTFWKEPYYDIEFSNGSTETIYETNLVVVPVAAVADKVAA